jgi:cell division protease FtsH
MTAGASNDIQRAVEIARSMVSEFGMSPLGPIYLGDPRSEPLSQSLLDRVEEAVNNIINTQLARACEVVTGEKESIARLVELLLEYDTVEADGLAQCFAVGNANRMNPSLTPPALGQLPQPATI